MCEVESVVNGRPNPRDPEALTPNHFLLSRSSPTLPPGLFVGKDKYSLRRWCQVQYLADVFWRHWIRGYLPALQERQKWKFLSRNFATDDIILVLNENLPRCSRPLGQAIEVFNNQHVGLVRSIKVKTKCSVLEWPVHKIVLLEGADSISSPVYVTRKSREICVHTSAFSCLLTFQTFGLM